MGKTFTGNSLYGGSYYIKDGFIQSGHAAVPEVTSGGNTITSPAGPYGGNSVGYDSDREISQGSRNLAAAMAATAGYDSSDFGDYIRELMQVSQNNTAKSQEFAREQMKFQRESDQLAMAWSAAEAQRNRDWQERLSNNAHQREVQDLIAAGLNPILSANQGAYTGSGATGQGFSSNGAMGQVDTTANNAMGQLYSTMLNTASQAAITQMYTDATKYQADLQYAASKAQTDASIFNNNNNIDAQKAINSMNRDSAIRQAQIHAGATMGAASMSAGATRYAAEQAANASMYGADLQYELSSEHNWQRDPLGYILGYTNALFSNNPKGNKAYNGWSNFVFPGQNGSQNDYAWSLGNGAS